MASSTQPQITQHAIEYDSEKSFIYKIGNWTLNTHTNQLSQGAKLVELENRLTNLLVYFLQRKGEVLTKDEILKAIWQKKVVNDDSVAVSISQLRKALEDNPRTPTYIKTIPGVGYQYIFQDIVNNDSTTLNQKAIESPTTKKRLTIGASLLLIFTVACIIWQFKTSNAPLEIAKGYAVIAEKNNVALDDFEKATEFFNRGDQVGWRMAIVFYRKAIIADPNNGKAYLGIAEAKTRLMNEEVFENENFEEIKALLTKAIELDNSLAKAHWQLADLIMGYNKDNNVAEEHYKASINISENDDESRFQYARFLLTQKRFDEAKVQINAARKINPLSYAYTNLVWLFLLEGDNQNATRELQRIENTEDRNKAFQIAAQNVYYNSGNEKKAYENMQWFFKEANFSQEKIEKLDHEFSMGGLQAVNKWLLDNKETADLGQYTPPISWARYALAAGQKEQALDYLDQAVKKHQAHSDCVIADPRYAPLFSEERFQKIVNNLTAPKNN